MSAQPHLLVDGANVAHAWPEFATLLRHDRERARAQLVQRLLVLHDVEERRLTVVFDGRGSELAVERPTGQASLSVLTTPSGTTADDVIEHLVAHAADPAACVVATGDRAVRETVEAAGGSCITPEELARWVERAQLRSSRAVQQLQAEVRKQWNHD